VIGFTLPLLAFTHAWQSMSLPGSRAAGSSGLWIAPVAHLRLGLQAMTGLSLLRPTELRRVRIRRLHRAVSSFSSSQQLHAGS
jgi:hypothetical protein